MPGQPGREEPTGERLATAAQSESLLAEAQGAADAAIGHLRKVAATATAEAQLTMAAAAAILAAAVLALALLVMSWLFLVALGVWLAIQAGLPVWLALALAVLVNLAGVWACRLWYARLAPNLGFARTRRLLP
ncbi:MAG TPA: hypothetical protein VFG91_11045 [Woeseiaceae bacterium]|nr:hypothetical protein [Woeseiaceae bacterium]